MSCVNRRVLEPGIRKALGAQSASVTLSTMPPLHRVIAAVAETRVEAEALRLAGDVRLGHVQQRRVDGKTLPLDARLRRNIREALEFVDELRPAIGVAGIIEGIHTDENIARAARFAQAQRKAQEDRVARWHVGNRYPLTHPILRDIDVAGQ